MRSLTCVSVVACVMRKLRPCPSYSRRRDRINLGLWRSFYKGGGVPLSFRFRQTAARALRQVLSPSSVLFRNEDPSMIVAGKQEGLPALCLAIRSANLISCSVLSAWICSSR